jgi:hypothetical protein
MDLTPSRNWSSWPKIYWVSDLNFICSTFNACWLLSFFFSKIPGVSPYKLSIYKNRFFAGPLLFLKCVWMLCLLKWLRHKILFFYNCCAMTLVRIDLLYGRNSFLTFLPFALFLALNLDSISKSVVILLSYYLDKGKLMKEKVFRVL